ncbi:acyl-CoA dehydrogenase family protein [Streptomyces sp. BE147]|nr:acyl-CoA dehydrogenase family protein [Streptomyces sp. BE147]MEE1741164.1 acyl-CoA dehydrogenase family protein [Streptomyces sp. BE147]
MTQQHTDLCQQVRAFGEAEIAPRVSAMEETRAVEHHLPQLIARQGWIGVAVSRRFGGMGAGHLAKTLIIEELSRVSAAMGTAAQASQLGTAMIVHHGSSEQQQDWLPRVADGSCLPTIAVTEPGSGSHVLGMESTARRSRGDWVLNGRKCFVGNSHVGGVHGVVVRTGRGRGHGSLSAFLVEADRPGLSVPAHRPRHGLHGFACGELVLDNCRIPAANMLGEPGDGLAVAYSSSILYGRANLAAVALGIHQAVVDTSSAYAGSQRRYGRPLAALSAVEQRLGQMRAGLMSGRVIAYDAVSRLDRGEACDDELVNAKLQTARWAQESAQWGMEVHGAAGLLVEHGIERLHRDAQHLWAPAGTGDIQAKRLAEGVTGHHTQHLPWSVLLAPSLASTCDGMTRSPAPSGVLAEAHA